jgi:hypothetical protein
VRRPRPDPKIQKNYVRESIAIARPPGFVAASIDPPTVTNSLTTAKPSDLLQVVMILR